MTKYEHGLDGTAVMPDAQERSRLLHELFCTDRLKIGLATVTNSQTLILLLFTHYSVFNFRKQWMRCLFDTVLPPQHLQQTSDELMSEVRNVLCLSRLAKKLVQSMPGHDLVPIVKRLSAVRSKPDCRLLREELSRECLGWELDCRINADRKMRPLGETSKLLHI